MGAAAITARLPLSRPPASARAASPALAFDRPGGPLVAVCGLVSGAGASTLAYALAERAARDSAAPVLVCEADPTPGGLAVLAGAATAHSLGELAAQVARGERPGAPFVTLPTGLRLIASTPRRVSPPAVHAQALLHDARAAHGLVVVDCGTLAGPQALAVLEVATHVLWTLPATALGLRRARIAHAMLAPRLAIAQSLVAVAVAPSSVRVRELRRFAEDRFDRLVLVPHTPALLENADAVPSEELAPTLTDLGTLLRRTA